MNKSVSLLTITQCSRNKCILNLVDFIKGQTYKAMEWVIVEGSKTEKEAVVNKEFIEREIKNKREMNLIINYIEYQAGSKLSDLRNRGNEHCKGDIIVCLDDDDYYPPERVEEAVTKLMASPYEIGGCSAIYLYHYRLDKLYQFKSFGRFHSTNNCFAYKKEYLLTHKHKPGIDVGEEISFTNCFTECMVQFTPEKCIVVSGHGANTFDKTPLCVKENTQITEIKKREIISTDILLKIKKVVLLL